MKFHEISLHAVEGAFYLRNIRILNEYDLVYKCEPGGDLTVRVRAAATESHVLLRFPRVDFAPSRCKGGASFSPRLRDRGCDLMLDQDWLILCSLLDHRAGVRS